MHHPDAFASLDDAFDPAANAQYAARFLTALHREFGGWDRATAAYHSQTGALGTEYARKVMAAWGHPMMVASPSAAESPALAAGSPYAAFAAADQQYRAFAPPSTMFAAFIDPATLPANLRGFGGLPERDLSERQGKRRKPTR